MDRLLLHPFKLRVRPATHIDVDSFDRRHTWTVLLLRPFKLRVHHYRK